MPTKSVVQVATLAPPAATDDSPRHALPGQEVAFVTYKTTLSFRGEAAFGNQAGAELSMVVVSASADRRPSQVFKLSEFDAKHSEHKDPLLAKTTVSGTISLPADLEPGTHTPPRTSACLWPAMCLVLRTKDISIHLREQAFHDDNISLHCSTWNAQS